MGDNAPPVQGNVLTFVASQSLWPLSAKGFLFGKQALLGAAFWFLGAGHDPSCLMVTR